MTQRARVLVIDDEPLFRNLMVTMLRRDFTVSVACEGSEGYYKAIEQTPDVALVDVQMPGWDGLKTLKAFRNHPILSKVKVVILTADASKETVLAAIHAGACEYLVKTHLSRETLLQTLEKVLPPASTVRREDAAVPAEVVGAPQLVGAVSGTRGTSTADVQEILDAWE